MHPDDAARIDRLRAAGWTEDKLATLAENLRDACNDRNRKPERVPPFNKDDKNETTTTTAS